MEYVRDDGMIWNIRRFSAFFRHVAQFAQTSMRSQNPVGDGERKRAIGRIMTTR